MHPTPTGKELRVGMQSDRVDISYSGNLYGAERRTSLSDMPGVNEPGRVGRKPKATATKTETPAKRAFSMAVGQTKSYSGRISAA